MTLSERLARARTERLLAAGLVNSEAALRPEPAEPPHEPGQQVAVDDPVTIEVGAAGLTTVAPPAPPAGDDRGDGAIEIEGQGTECPNCHRAGKVDMVDLVGHTVHLTCPACGTMWRARHTVNQPRS